MPSHTSLEMVALKSGEKKRSRSTSFKSLKLPSKKFKGLTAKLGSVSNAPPEENSSGTVTMAPNFPTRGSSTAQQLVHQYRDRIKIPDVTVTRNRSHVYIFPHADECISVGHQNRFPVVEDIFKQNLLKCTELALKHPTKTEFKLKMCGTSMKTATPSILIHHPQKDKKTGLRILDLLHRSPVLKQYHSSHMSVCFDIYLFSGQAFKAMGRPMDGLSIQKQDSYIPGALLLDDACNRVSTIACGIKFSDADSTVFLLTTAHAFEEDEESGERENATEEAVSAMLPALGDQEDKNDGIYIFGDLVYDISEPQEHDDTDKEEQLPQGTEKRTNLSQDAPAQTDGLVQTSKTEDVITPEHVWGRPLSPEWDSCPNLDWALVEIGTSKQWKAQKLDPTIHDTPDLGYQSRDVQVITSRGSLSGTISSIPSFIANSSNLNSLCKVWVVSLVDPSQIVVGDSGSLVIDSITKQPYGYLIGINHFQELYIIPLRATLKQISQMMPNSYSNPEIFLELVSRPIPGDSPIGGNCSELTKTLSPYWTKEKTNNLSIYFDETSWNEYNSSDSGDFYFDCPTSPLLDYPNEGNTSPSLPSLTTSFTSCITRAQSPSAELESTSHQMLHNSIDCRIDSASQSFEDFPSSYRTAENEIREEGESSDPNSKVTNNK